MLNLLLASAAFLPQGPGTSLAPVVINEFVYDDGGTDDREFVELYNRMSTPVDISGWKIVCNDQASPGYGGSGTGAVPTHTIPGGTILAPGAFYLLGNALIVPFPVAGFSQQIPVNGLENGGSGTSFEFESIELQNPTGTIIDSVVVEMGYAIGPFGPHPIEGPGLFGDFGVGDGAGLPSSSIGRAIDGWDNNYNPTDFLAGMVPTPGVSNARPAGIPFVDTFDAGVIGSPIPGWAGGFVAPRYVDPMVIDAQNLSSKPASPAGGAAMSIWDTTGGGNSVTFDMSPVQDVVVETYVWIEPTMLPVNPQTTPYVNGNPAFVPGTFNAGDGETWYLGVRGSTAGNANPPNVSGTYYTEIALGVGLRAHYLTGIAWICHRTTVSCKLFLVDFRDGPTNVSPYNHVVLAGPIDILPGINDGWQRLRLHVQGNQVIGNFGGSYGYDDGQRFATTTTTNQLGQVYFGYREACLYNGNCRPPLFDLFDAHAPSTSRSIYGVASPTTVGTPTIDSNGLAIAGSTGFAIRGTGMIPLGAPNYAFCAVALGFSSLPSGYPVPGTPATVLAYPLPILVANIGFANPSGAVSFPFPLPLTNAYNGIPIVAQLIDFDPLLPFAAPIGTSQGMDCVIGS